MEQLELPFAMAGRSLFCLGNTAPLWSLYRATTIVTLHSVSFLEKSSSYHPAFRLFYRLLIPHVLRAAKAVITVSQSEKANILRHYPWTGRNLQVVEHGVFNDRLMAVAGHGGMRPNINSRIILFVGSLSRLKNIAGFIQAAALISREASFQYHIIGGTDRAFANLNIPIPSEVRACVHFLGQVDDPYQMIQAYQSAFCLVFPSFYESSGMPPLEAMASGCPAIVSKLPALEERCADAVLYCDPAHPETICQQVRRLLQDPALYEAITNKGRALSRKYTWRQAAEKTLAIIKSVLPE